MERFALCSHFHCTPQQLREEFEYQEVADFSELLQKLHDKAEMDQKRQQSAPSMRRY